jgi:uncharacterized SAM-binding protein YcdF (DUF218 family)
VNSLVVELGLGAWKPVLTALVLPPLPFLLLQLAGAALLWLRRGIGWLLVVVATAGLWLSSSIGVGQALGFTLLHPPRALSGAQLDALAREARTRKDVAIVALGGGREAHAPEYGQSNLTATSMERLRYGVWLSRATGIPLAFSGGTGHARSKGMSEADIAARIAAEEFRHRLRWIENRSRDTRENARNSIQLLGDAGVRRIVLVTHGWHMRRALRAFEEAAGGRIEIIPAPMALAPRAERTSLLWLPSADGFMLVRQVLREALGLAAGS